MQPQGLGGYGRYGRRECKAPGESGLTLDDILSSLQGELLKGREAGAELDLLARRKGFPIPSANHW
jgi:hypothetical protein